jgi:hypothetical protein
MVACEVKMRNTTVLSNMGGTNVMGRSTYTESPVEIVTSRDRTAYASTPDFCTHSIGKPGDVNKAIWMPVMRGASAVSGEGTNPYADWVFHDAASLAPNILGDSTCLSFWTSSPVAQSFSIEITTHWEAILLVNANQLATPSLTVVDATLAFALLANSISQYPLVSQTRSIENDDGPIESVVKDVKTIFGAGKSLFNAGKKAWGFVKGMFSHGKGPEFTAYQLLSGGLDEKALLTAVEICKQHDYKIDKLKAAYSAKIDYRKRLQQSARLGVMQFTGVREGVARVATSEFPH